MGQRLLKKTQPAEAASGDPVIGIGPDESVLILIKHCSDMKQQEMRLRLITLFLLLSCMALILFTGRVDLRRQENSTSVGRGTAAVTSPAFIRQDKNCPTAPDNPPATLQKWHIHLIHIGSAPTREEMDGQYITWDAEFGSESYSKTKHAIVIPQNGLYFIYVRIALRCHGLEDATEPRLFSLELHNWNKGYNKTVCLTEAWDDVDCSQEGARNVFVGQLFDLLQGDHISVQIKQGYPLITKSLFGAYVT